MSESASISAGSVEPVLTHMDALPLGTTLGEFELRGLLGVGGFGIVYRAYDHSLQRMVAIKEYLPSALVGRGADMLVSARSTVDAVPFQAGLKSFISEARLLARFDHPSLVKVYRFWEANNTAYMAMPLYQGCTLKEARSHMTGPPPEDWLRTVLWSVLEALKVLHANNTLHRDISPDNIFLQDRGPPVLLDLGAARRAISDGNRKHTAILKVNYAPIEQYADSEELREGPWTDLYSIAAVMHGCLRNEPPLPATMRAVKDTLPPFAKLAETAASHFNTPYSAGFVRVIDHALVLQPAGRPQSVEAFCVEMRLRRPSAIASFDWRAALGDRIRSQSPDSLVAGSTQPFVPTQAQTIPDPNAATAVTVLVPPVSQRRSKSRRTKSSVESGDAAASAWVMGVLWATVAMACAAMIFWALSGRNKSAPTPANIVATNTLAAASAPVVAPVAVASAPVQPPSQSAVAAVAPPSVAASQVPLPKQSAPAKVAQRSAAKVPSSEPAAKADAPANHDAVTKPVHDAKPEPASVVREAPVQNASTTYRDLCPDSNFFSRPMCIYRECQKSENARLPVCIEDRKRWENRDKAQ